MTEHASDGAERPDSPLERDRVVEALCDHYARDHLAMDEFERRVDRAHRARTRAELREVLSGLPALTGSGSAGASGVPADPRTAGTSGGTGVARTDAPENPRSWIALDPGIPVPERQTEIAIFSGRVRKGGWIPARRILGLAMMGGVELDFREAQLPPGETRVVVMACMGGVDVVVPPGVRVETDGFALLGGFDEDVDIFEAAEPDAPVIRISGFAFLGGVDVTCRYAGESPRQARRRRKEDQRLRREEQRRLNRGDEG